MKNLNPSSPKKCKSAKKHSRPLSIKNRMKEVRKKLLLAPPAILPPLLTFGNPFCFTLAPENTTEFFKFFCHRYIFTSHFVEQLLPLNMCPHIYLCASLVYSALRTRPIIHLLHRFKFTGSQRKDGLEAEIYYQQRRFDLVEAKTLKSRRLPFLVAKPDLVAFAFEDKTKVDFIVEVKSSEHEHELKVIAQRCNAQVEMQVLSSMIAHDAPKALLVTILKTSNPFEPFKILDEIEIIRNERLVSTLCRKLPTKYIQNVIFPFLKTECCVEFTRSDKRRLCAWFRNSCLLFAQDRLENPFGPAQPHRFHAQGLERIDCFKRYKEVFSNLSSLTYL